MEFVKCPSHGTIPPGYKVSYKLIQVIISLCEKFLSNPFNLRKRINKHFTYFRFYNSNKIYFHLFINCDHYFVVSNIIFFYILRSFDYVRPKLYITKFKRLFRAQILNYSKNPACTKGWFRTKHPKYSVSHSRYDDDLFVWSTEASELPNRYFYSWHLTELHMKIILIRNCFKLAKNVLF